MLLVNLTTCIGMTTRAQTHIPSPFAHQRLMVQVKSAYAWRGGGGVGGRMINCDFSFTYNNLLSKIAVNY